MIVRHDRLDRATLVNPDDWPAFTSFFRGHGAATLIAPSWMLTAAHVARRIPIERQLHVKIAEKRYPIARVILHPAFRPGWEDNEAEYDEPVVDLALVELGAPVTDVAPITPYTGADEVGREVTLLGRGSSGNGRRGMMSGSDRQLRLGTNRIESADEEWLTFRFDAPPEGTALEGVCGMGDSGGPALLRKGGQWLLAGVSSWQDHGDRPMGTYGCVEYFARVSRFAAWLRAQVARSHAAP
jgi:Trypsin